MYKNLLFIFIALWSFCMNGVSRDRKELLDFGWRFLKGEAPVGSVKPDFDDGKWRIVDLPHDWSRAYPVKMNLLVEMEVIVPMEKDVIGKHFKSIRRKSEKSSAFILKVSI